jgi:hypothetical protein
MKTQSPDTPLEVEEFLLARYRSMSPREKLHRVFDLNQTVRELAAARIRAEHGPQISERELRFRLVSLWLDRSTMIKAFGWDPEVQGY